MTMQQFRQLDEMEKVSAIMKSGTLMAQNLQGNQRIFVYRFQSFYISASYSVTDDQLIEIKSFPAAGHLVPEYRRQMIAINPAEREYETPEI